MPYNFVAIFRIWYKNLDRFFPFLSQITSLTKEQTDRQLFHR